MKNVLTRRGFAGSAAVAAVLFNARIAFADGGMSLDKKGRAIKGYDTHSYWTKGDALRGSESHVVNWNGATWQFATAEDAAAFAANPEAYAVQFGGYCARALSLKKVVPADPKVWRIYKDKLYMFARPIGGTKFDEGPDALLEKANAFWDTL